MIQIPGSSQINPGGVPLPSRNLKETPMDKLTELGTSLRKGLGLPMMVAELAGLGNAKKAEISVNKGERPKVKLDLKEEKEKVIVPDPREKGVVK